jgi:hypothetical protein
MNIEFVRSEPSLRYIWPSSEIANYAPVEVWRVDDSGRSAEFGIAYGWSPAFERNRRRIVVFLMQPLWSAVELAGTDSYDLEKTLVWAGKKPGGNKQYSASDPLDPEFEPFRKVVHRHRISGKRAFSGWAIELKEDEHRDMVRLAWIRARHRGYFQD